MFLFSRSSFLKRLGLSPGSSGHLAFHGEFYEGISWDKDHAKALQSVKLGLLKKGLLSGFGFYNWAGHRCREALIKAEADGKELVDIVATGDEADIGCKLDVSELAKKTVEFLFDTENFDASGEKSGISITLENDDSGEEEIRVQPGWEAKFLIRPKLHTTSSALLKRQEKIYR